MATATFDYTGSVGFPDLLILAQNYGSTLLTTGGSTLLTTGAAATTATASARRPLPRHRLVN